MKVVIIGSGYTAVWAYRALNRWLGKKAELTVVTKYPYHSFHGFIGEVLAGNLPPHLTYSPLDECFPKARHVIGEATQINAAQNTVAVKTADSAVTLPYDHVLIATGADEHTDSVPGLTEHGFRLRTPGVPQQIVEKLTAIAQDAQPGTYTAANTAVVIGAGFTGTESAAALKRRFGDKLQVVLVAATAAVIPSWSEKAYLQKHLLHNLKATGVRVISNTRVARVDADNVYLTDGTSIPSQTTIASMGMRPVHIGGLEQYTDAQTHLLVVDRCLHVADNIWAAGDVAAVKNRRGTLVTKDALWAIYAGTRVGRNIARISRGKQPKPFTFPGLGSVATFAPGRSVGRLMGMSLSGVHLYALRQGLFFWFIPSRANAARVIRSLWQNRKAGRAHLSQADLA